MDGFYPGMLQLVLTNDIKNIEVSKFFSSSAYTILIIKLDTTTNFILYITALTLLHSERPKLYTIFSSAVFEENIELYS